MDIDFEKIRHTLISSLDKIKQDNDFNKEELKIIDQQKITAELITSALKMYHEQITSKAD